MRLCKCGKEVAKKFKRDRSFAGYHKTCGAEECLKPTSETIEKIRLGNLGKVYSPETRLRISLAKRGSKSHFWRGGISTENEKFRRSGQYKAWRESVFERDDYTCQICFVRGGHLHADHIKPFSRFPQLRLDIDNGRTLCESCHYKTDTYGSKMLKYVVSS